MNYVVLDLEWNQAPVPAVENKDIPFEIIEIGAVRLNDALEKTGEFSRLVAPRVYRKMHTHTKRLIKLSIQELREQGGYFTDVMKEFKEFAGDDYIFCTWGSQDLTELQRNMDYYRVPLFSKGPLPFLDVQKLFHLAFDREGNRPSLETAVDKLEIDKDIPFHRALADAEYTSRILSALPDEVLEYESYDLYLKPGNKSEEIHRVFSDYGKHISRKFSSKAEALNEKDISSVRCYLCKNEIERLEDWFTPNGKHYYALGRCKRHGFMKSKIRLHKASEDGRIYVVKTMKFIDEEGVREIGKLKEREAYFHELPRKNRKNVTLPR